MAPASGTPSESMTMPATEAVWDVAPGLGKTNPPGAAMGPPAVQESRRLARETARPPSVKPSRRREDRIGTGVNQIHISVRNRTPKDIPTSRGSDENYRHTRIGVGIIILFPGITTRNVGNPAQPIGAKPAP